MDKTEPICGGEHEHDGEEKYGLVKNTRTYNSRIADRNYRSSKSSTLISDLSLLHLRTIEEISISLSALMMSFSPMLPLVSSELALHFSYGSSSTPNTEISPTYNKHSLYPSHRPILHSCPSRATSLPALPPNPWPTALQLGSDNAAIFLLTSANKPVASPPAPPHALAELADSFDAPAALPR